MNNRLQKIVRYALYGVFAIVAGFLAFFSDERQSDYSVTNFKSGENNGVNDSYFSPEFVSADYPSVPVGGEPFADDGGGGGDDSWR